MISQETRRARPEDLGVARRQSRQASAQLASAFDIESPIGQKWKQAGGEATLGKPVESPIPMPGGKGTYQQFEKGVIFQSTAYGARRVPNAIFSKWNSLSVSLKKELGCPTDDAFSDRNTQAVYFEKGMVVVRPDGKAFEVHGQIYGRYRDLGDVKSVLGLPVSDEAAAPKGGRQSRFDKGDIYYHPNTGAREVHGAIRARWMELGGAAKFMGYPVTNELSVMDKGREVGRFNRFEGGTIYWSSQTGAWDVYGAILSTWENEYGGATGILGFPTSGETATPTSGGRYNNFQKGVLVWHPGSHQFKGVYGFTSLEFFMDRFGSKGDDGLFSGGQDLYVKVDVHASTGERFNQRMPKDGDFDSSEEIDRVFIKVPTVQSDLVINVKMEGWDSETFSDKRLGIVEERYSIDNLWGTLEDAEHWRRNFLAVYKLRVPGTIDPNKPFREQCFWAFENFSTETLTEQQYAQTFRDVSEIEKFSALDPGTWRPFDRTFYKTVYKGIASGGNCFGMCLESIYARVGRSIYDDPIYRFGPRSGEPKLPGDREIINEINLKHGYQASAEAIHWFMAEFAAGNTHNPVHAFKSSRACYQRGDYPVMVVTEGYFNVGGHVVLPYEWDDSNPDRWNIRIADPNVPYSAQTDKNHERCRIEVNPRNNTFRYVHRANDIWTGGEWTGGRMYPIPFSRLSMHPRTPFWEVFALLVSGTLILVGDDADTRQLTDDKSRTFYEEGLTRAPDQWEQIRQDTSKRIPQMARIPLLANSAQAVLPELYFVQGQTAKTLTQEIATRSGKAYQWAMQSAVLSASINAMGQGKTETLQLEEVNSEQPTIALASERSTADRNLTLELAGGVEKTKKFELRHLQIKSDQRMRACLDDGGQELVLENAGPETTFELYVQSKGGDPAQARPRSVTVEAGKAARLRPLDWSAEGVNHAPLRLDILDDVRGPVRRRIEL